MPAEPAPFNKWDPDGTEARAAAIARRIAAGEVPETARKAVASYAPQPDPLAGKKWLLRWWAILGTAVMVFGYIIMAIVLTGHGDWIGM